MSTDQLDLFAARPLPAPLAGWTCYHDGDLIAMRHTSHVLLRAATIDEAETQRHLAHSWCELLDAGGWLGHYDPRATIAGLLPWTAIHQQYAVIAAVTLPDLAWEAWRAAQDEYALPDLDDALLRALFLAGWRWDGQALVRDGEMIDLMNVQIGELWYLAQQEGG